jgi:hypothetical protein
MQWHGKHVSAAVNKHTATEEPWKQCFLTVLCLCYIARTIGVSDMTPV